MINKNNNDEPLEEIDIEWEWLNESVNECVCECMCVRVQMNEWMNKWMWDNRKMSRKYMRKRNGTHTHTPNVNSYKRDNRQNNIVHVLYKNIAPDNEETFLWFVPYKLAISLSLSLDRSFALIYCFPLICSESKSKRNFIENMKLKICVCSFFNSTCKF